MARFETIADLSDAEERYEIEVNIEHEEPNSALLFISSEEHGHIGAMTVPRAELIAWCERIVDRLRAAGEGGEA